MNNSFERELVKIKTHLIRYRNDERRYNMCWNVYKELYEEYFNQFKIEGSKND